MIADFFKQSKPIVFIVLFTGLSLSFFLELKQLIPATPDLDFIVVYGLKYVSLIAVFLIFISVLKQFEVQKRHGLGSFYFTLFSIFCMPFLIEGSTLFALLFLSLGIYNAYKLMASSTLNLVLFQMVVFIFIAGLLEPTFVYLLFMVLVATFLFTTPKWRLFIIPVYAIATVVLWCQVYGMITSNSIYGYEFFFQKWTFNFDSFYAKNAIAISVFWAFVVLIFIYQFIKVKEKRAIFHRNNAKFFIFFMVIGLVSQILTTPSLEKIWVLSIWPFAIYIADFVWRIRKRLWMGVFIWVSIASILLMHLIY